MKNLINNFIGLLTLLDLKMKEVLTHLALYWRVNYVLLNIVSVVNTPSGGRLPFVGMASIGLATKGCSATDRLLSPRLPNQMSKGGNLPPLYFEHYVGSSGLPVNVQIYRWPFSGICYALNSRTRVCHYSNGKPAVIPVKNYGNVYSDCTQIILENKGKAGVYRWTNLTNEKSYIGSSVNLGKRLSGYFKISFLEKELTRGNSAIYSALLKHGYANFSLEILEYCDLTAAIKREQYYLDLLEPKYNILKTAGSTLGFKHSLETRAKMSASSKGRTMAANQKAIFSKRLKRLHADPKFRAKCLKGLKVYLFSKKNQEHLKRINADPEIQANRLERLKNIKANPELRAKRSLAIAAHNFSKKNQEHLKQINADPEIQANRLVHLKNINVNPEVKAKRLARIHEIQSHKISVLDSQNNETSVYPSIREAAKVLGITPQGISQAFKRKGESSIWVKEKRYQITKLSTE